MAIVRRGKRESYDNIAAGSATGYERTKTDTVTYIEMPGGGFRTSTSTGDVNHSNITAGVSVSNDAADGTVAGGAMAEHVVQSGVTNTEEQLG